MRVDNITRNIAVITGDISHFTRLKDEERQNLIQDTRKLIHGWVSKESDAAIFRGDSYQILLEDTDKALEKSLQLIAWFIKQPHSEEVLKMGTRLSLGIGEVSYRGNSVLDSDGEAFHLSGRNLDTMEQDEFIQIHTPNEGMNETLRILLLFMNMVIREWTPGQAEAIFYQLMPDRPIQSEIARILNIHQSGIANRLKLAHWKEMEKALEFLKNQIREL